MEFRRVLFRADRADEPVGADHQFIAGAIRGGDANHARADVVTDRKRVEIILDVLGIIGRQPVDDGGAKGSARRLIVAVRSEEHTSELQSLMRISYAVFCLKKTTPKQH